MLWVILSILAAIGWAVVGTVDKYIITKWAKPIIPVMIRGIIGMIISLLIYVIHGYSQLSSFNIFLSIIIGIAYVFVGFFYFRAVKIEEISRVAQLWYLYPLFTLILAAIFLREILTPIKYIGVILVLIGAIFISSKKFIRLTLGKAFVYMILANIVLATYMVVTKYLLQYADFWTVFSYLRIGTFLGTIPILFFNFSDIVNVVMEHGKKVIGVISLNESLNMFDMLLIAIAMVIGYATIVNTLYSTQAFFVLFFSLILSISYPKILREEIGKSTVLLKLIAAFLMFSGTYLILF